MTIGFVKYLSSVIIEFVDDKRLSYLDKAVIACIYLCAFTIILSIALAQMFAILLIVFSLIQLIWCQQRYKISKTPFNVPLLAFIMIRIISVLLSSNISLSLRILYTEVPYYAIFFAITRREELIQRRYIISILWIFIIAAVIASCYGITTVLFGLKERATSLVSGYYTLGSYLTAMISILLVAGRSKLFEKKRWLWYSIIIILAAGILLTLNRIHWGITILVFLIVGLIQERKLLVLATIGFIIVMFISPRVGQRLKETINFTTNLSGRDVIWKGASMIWYDHSVIGYGPGTFLEVFPITSQLEDVHVGGWHNDYLQVFIESGALGLLALLWLIVTVYKRVLKYLRLQQADVLDRKLIVALTFGISTIFLSSLTGSAFLDILILMTMTYYLAFLSILMQTNSRDVKMSLNDGMRS